MSTPQSPGHRETERTYDPAPDQALPDLLGVPGVTAVEALPVVELAATYLDTVSLDLLRHGVTLRRREGGDDAGWHLKLARVGDTREELHVPLGAQGEPVPTPLTDLVYGVILGRPLVPLAVLRTARTRTLLRDGVTVLAEVADDVVTAGTTPPGGLPQVRSWREWEVELVAAGPDLLEEVEEVLLRAGAEVATHPSKLARALGDAAPVLPRRPRSPKAGKPAARVLHHYLLDQVAAVQHADLAVRRGEGEGVHDLRVALRRVRSALATWRPLLDREVTDPLREQLRDVGGRLGHVRDDEVVHARLIELLDDEPADLALGDARRVVAEQATLAADQGRRAALDILRGPEHLALLGALQALVAAPPWTARAEETAGDLVRSRLRKEVRRLRERVVEVEAADGPGPRAEALHEVRKAAKRLRYAAEAAHPVAGARARRLRRGAASLQRILGEHHDTMATRAALVRLVGRGDLHPGTGFSLGRLHAREEQVALELERAGIERWERLLG